ncbi:MAG: hypothetical protein RRY35_01465 [Clostridiales bacterium]
MTFGKRAVTSKYHTRNLRCSGEGLRCVFCVAVLSMPMNYLAEGEN